MDIIDTYDSEDIKDILHAEEGVALGIVCLDMDGGEDIMEAPERGHFYTDAFLDEDRETTGLACDGLYYLATDGTVFSVDDSTGAYKATSRMPSFVEQVDPVAPIDPEDAAAIDNQMAAKEAIESKLTAFAALVGSKADASWSTVIACAKTIVDLTKALGRHAAEHGLDPVIRSAKIVDATRRFASAYALNPEVAHAFVTMPGGIEAVDLTAEAIERW